MVTEKENIIARYQNENVYIELMKNEIRLSGIDSNTNKLFIFLGIEDLNIFIRETKGYFEITIKDELAGDVLECVYMDNESYNDFMKWYRELVTISGMIIDKVYKISNDLESKLMITNNESSKSMLDMSDRNLYISVKFKKDFKRIKEKNKKSHVLEILSKLVNLLHNSPEEVSSYLKKLNAKKFKNIHDYWKFYVSRSQRIIYAYGKDFNRMDHKDSIFILRFVDDHDEQSIMAKKANSLVYKEAYLFNDHDNHHQFDVQVMDDYSIDDDIAYIALAGQVEDVLLGKNKAGVLLNRDQISCLNTDIPLIVKGSAGSGKTIVSVEIMKIAQKLSSQAVYITFTEGLRKYAKEQFELVSGSGTNNFYSFSEYCLTRLGHSRRQFSGFNEFDKWFRGNYSHLSYKSIELWYEIRGIVKGFMGRNWNPDILLERTIDEEEYINGRGFESKFDEEERREIYRIVIKYNDWLDSCNCCDDNDLAYYMYMRNKHEKISNIPVLVIDEIQDFTERQIVMMAGMTQNYNMYLCGDSNQIINPTYFSFGRVSNFFYNQQKKSPRIITLKNNYRNSAPVVEFINYVTLKRKEMIGFQKRDDDALERPMRTDTFGTRILNIKHTDENLKEVVDLFEETPSAAIIVTSEKEKEILERRTRSGLQSVFTIFEVKGLEFNHILCYNIFSNYKNIWNEILNGTGKRSSVHRFHFNVFYVAITRAKEYISIFEDSLNPFLHEDIDFKCIKEVNEQTMELDALRDSLEWYEEGNMFEKAGLYAKAIFAYGKYYSLSGLDLRKDIKRCEAYIILESNKTFEGFLEAGNKLMEAEEYDRALEIFNDIGLKYKIYECKLKNGVYDYKHDFSKEEMKLILKQGMEDEGFLDYLVEAYFIPRAKNLVTNSKMLKEILLPELLEVHNE